MRCFRPCLEVLPPAQQEIWPRLKGIAQLSVVLYGGTAVALYFGHRTSVDFDFFSSEPLDKPGPIGAVSLSSPMGDCEELVEFPRAPRRGTLSI